MPTTRNGEVLQPLLVLKPARWKWVRVLAILLLFVAAGVFILSREPNWSKRVMAWLCIAFFGLGVPVALLQLFSDRNRTVITQIGIHIGSIFKQTTLRWEEIEGFGVAGWTQWHGPFRQRHRMVGINFKEGSEAMARARRGARLSMALVGYHGALPDNYGYKHQELADILNGYLLRFGGQKNRP